MPFLLKVSPIPRGGLVKGAGSSILNTAPAGHCSARDQVKDLLTILYTVLPAPGCSLQIKS